MRFTHGSHAERFSNVASETTGSGLQRLKGAVAWFDCAVEQIVSAGDHDILIGRVRTVGTTDEAALVYARRQFGTLLANA